MRIYMYGKVVHINRNYIIIENNGSGELIYVANVDKFKKDENTKIFIHEYQSEYFQTTYGFTNFKELVVFEDLLSIQGIGPKTAISVLSIGWQNIIKYVANSSIDKLSEIPYLSTRSARQIIFEFQPKYERFLQKMSQNTQNDTEKTDDAEFSDPKQETPKVSENTKNLEKSLKMLGFKQKQIRYAVTKVQPVEDLEKAVEEAIKILSKQSQDAVV